MDNGLSIYGPYEGAGTRAEHDLINDDGSRSYMWSGPSGFGTTFDMTYDCWLVTMKVFGYTYGQTHNVVLNCFGWNSTYNRPDENNSYFDGEVSFPGSGPYSDTWATFDVSGEHAFFEDNDRITLFSRGGSYPWYCPEDGNASAPPRSGWMWFGGSSWSDFSTYGYGAMMVRGVVNDDMDPPYVDSQDPADGAWAPTDTTIVFHCKDDDMDGPYVDEQDPADGGWAAPETSIFFHCKDNDKGVESDTIDFSADDGTRAGVSGSLYIDDTDPNDVICIFSPDSDLPEGETITCTVAGTLADGLGNEMGYDAVWSFTVGQTNVNDASLGEIKAGYH